MAAENPAQLGPGLPKAPAPKATASVCRWSRWIAWVVMLNDSQVNGGYMVDQAAVDDGINDSSFMNETVDDHL